MKAKIYSLIILLMAMMIIAGCKKKDSNDSNSSETGTWNIQVNNLDGSTLVVAKGTFTFTATGFNVHIITSRIGGGSIVKEFDMSGEKSGDSIFLNNFVLNLTDPAEVAVVNGSVGVQTATMNGSGNYSIVQPPDTLHYYDQFLVTATRE